MTFSGVPADAAIVDLSAIGAAGRPSLIESISRTACQFTGTLIFWVRESSE